MTKKDFSKSNVVNKFISQPIISYPDEKVNSSDQLLKDDTETKSKRLNLLIRPSLHEDIRKIAYINELSLNEQISICLEEFVRINQNKVDKYDELKR